MVKTLCKCWAGAIVFSPSSRLHLAEKCLRALPLSLHLQRFQTAPGAEDGCPEALCAVLPGWEGAQPGAEALCDGVLPGPSCLLCPHTLRKLVLGFWGPLKPLFPRHCMAAPSSHYTSTVWQVERQACARCLARGSSQCPHEHGPFTRVSIAVQQRGRAG